MPIRYEKTSTRERKSRKLGKRHSGSVIMERKSLSIRKSEENSNVMSSDSERTTPKLKWPQENLLKFQKSNQFTGSKSSTCQSETERPCRIKRARVFKNYSLTTNR